MIIPLLSITILFCALALLCILTIIDLRHYLLPNIYVFPFGILGFLFHFTNNFDFLPLAQTLLGCGLGYGILYLIRLGGNYYYKQESLGLGDVKLLAAAGLWLGAEGVMIAMTAGAFAGLLHGLFIAAMHTIIKKQKFNISRLKIPAGPGFIVGIIMAFVWLYGQDIQSIWYNLIL